jgi:hypothetical protein
VLDDIAAVQDCTPAVASAPSHLFNPRTGFLLGGQAARTADALMRGGPEVPSNAGENPPQRVPITYHLRAASGPATVSILDVKGEVVRTLDGPRAAGINRVWWNFDRTPVALAGGRGGGAGGDDEGGGGGRGGARVPAGAYTVRLSVDGRV